jgi:hypothetical protein
MNSIFSHWKSVKSDLHTSVTAQAILADTQPHTIQTMAGEHLDKASYIIRPEIEVIFVDRNHPFQELFKNFVDI